MLLFSSSDGCARRRRSNCRSIIAGTRRVSEKRRARTGATRLASSASISSRRLSRCRMQQGRMAHNGTCMQQGRMAHNGTCMQQQTARWAVCSEHSRTGCSPRRSVAAVCDHVARRGCIMEGARVDDPCLGGVLRLPRLALPGCAAVPAALRTHKHPTDGRVWPVYCTTNGATLAC